MLPSLLHLLSPLMQETVSGTEIIDPLVPKDVSLLCPYTAWVKALLLLLLCPCTN